MKTKQSLITGVMLTALSVCTYEAKASSLTEYTQQKDGLLPLPSTTEMVPDSVKYLSDISQFMEHLSQSVTEAIDGKNMEQLIQLALQEYVKEKIPNASSSEEVNSVISALYNKFTSLEPSDIDIILDKLSSIKGIGDIAPQDINRIIVAGIKNTNIEPILKQLREMKTETDQIITSGNNIWKQIKRSFSSCCSNTD